MMWERLEREQADPAVLGEKCLGKKYAVRKCFKLTALIL